MIAATLAIDIACGAAVLDTSLMQLREWSGPMNGSPDRRLARIAAGQLITAMAIGPPLHAATTIGEELGWRDFLLPRLMRIGLGRWSALAVTGVVWGSGMSL